MPQVRMMLSDLARKKDLALLCINDDVTEDHAEITSYFRGWQEKRWGTPAAWEADIAHHHRRRDSEDEEREREDGWARWGGASAAQEAADVIYEPDPRY